MIRIEASVYNHYENTQQHTCCLDFEEITLYQLQNGLEFRRRFLNQFTLLYIEKGVFDIYVESKLLHLEEKSLLLIISLYTEPRGRQTSVKHAFFTCWNFAVTILTFFLWTNICCFPAPSLWKPYWQSCIMSTRHSSTILVFMTRGFCS